MDAPFAAELRRLVDAVEGPPLCTLATLQADGAPAARTVVVRGVNDDGSVLACSDARSEKNHQLHADPRASACFWFEPQRTQFRLRGSVTILPHDDDESARVWRSMSDKGRALFAWPQPKAAKEDDDQFAAELAEAAGPPANFEVLRLVPAACDRLVLKGVPHRRTLWLREGEHWRDVEVNP